MGLLLMLTYSKRRLRYDPLLLLVHNERLKSLSELPSLCFCLSAMYCPSLENISNWKAPLLHHLNSNHIRGQTDLHGCENLDQNTRNIVLSGCGIFQILSGLKFGSMNTRNMLTDQAVIHIVSRLKFGRTSERCHDFRYPGDEIPSEMMPHQQPPLKAFMHIKSVDAKASSLSVVSALFRFFFCLFSSYSVSANDALVDDSDDAPPI
ncbi:hypothetical protein FEM48_Zijuj11G0014000 [Ziziphus jujuba var. spinosa]|uniref:Uncharacterized protein n=1 Tax=Ziziphus jujuba var. spinosa TaxID=714518 RepID=A0A978UG14_ZIZJJ|nr:hypothetical protein FEM48_Zijuj11G0014000 [Ziziphus jujuba var. spinosa]